MTDIITKFNLTDGDMEHIGWVIEMARASFIEQYPDASEYDMQQAMGRVACEESGRCCEYRENEA